MADTNKTLLSTLSFPTDKHIRQNAVESIINEIDRNRIKLTIGREELYLIVDEAITNAMEHGNSWDPSKKINVELISNTSHFYIYITDEGKGFNTKTIIKELNNRNVLSTRGRGIYIISQFCELSWNDRGNQFKMKIPKGN